MKTRWPIVMMVAGMVSVAAPTLAQTDEEIDPDRPDVTDSPHVVPRGLVQIEVGGLYLRQTRQQHSGGVPFTLRIGMFDWLEARVDADGPMTRTTEVARVTGFGNVQLGG